MPRSEKDNQEIRDARREELLDAAVAVFARKGFARSKIADIAAASGLSHGLVYHYFASKDAILAAIVERVVASLHADLDEDEPRALLRLARAIERSRARSREPVDAGRLVVQAMMQGQLPEPVRARLAAHLDEVWKTAVSWIRDAKAQGDADPDLDPEEAAAALVCLMRGMSIRMPGIELPFPPPRVEMVLRLVRAPAGAERGGIARRGAGSTRPRGRKDGSRARK